MADHTSMPKVDNTFAGVVLTAQTFNPSIFTETWLARNGLVTAESFVGVRVFSAELAQFQTAGLQVLVIPPKMQVTFCIHGNPEASHLPRQFVTRIVELLPHTPYQALGLNFDFFIAPPNGQDFNGYNRTLLGTGGIRLLQEFSSPDARFGRYFSKNHGEARLKLDVKPVQADQEKKDLLQFSFNFHYEVSSLSPEDRPRKLTEFVGQWGSLRQYAERLVNLGSTSEVGA